MNSIIKTYCLRVAEVGLALLFIAFILSLVLPRFQESTVQEAAVKEKAKPALSDMTLPITN